MSYASQTVLDHAKLVASPLVPAPAPPDAPGSDRAVAPSASDG